MVACLALMGACLAHGRVLGAHIGRGVGARGRGLVAHGRVLGAEGRVLSAEGRAGAVANRLPFLPQAFSALRVHPPSSLDLSVFYKHRVSTF